MRRKSSPSKPVTMADIARATGLSKMTVSRVLNNSPLVHPATRKKVEAAMRRLGFRPNILAQRFFTGRTRLLGVVAPLEYIFRSRYFQELFGGIFRRTEENGYDVLFHNAAMQMRSVEDKCLEMVKGRLVEGLLIIAPMIYDDYPKRLLSNGVPLVVLGETVCGDAVNRAVTPNREIAARMTRYLVDHGHRKIALLTFGRDHVESIERETGFRSVVKKAGILDTKLILAAQYDRMLAFREVYELLSSRKDVTAVFALNADMALGAADAIKALGLRIPHDVSLAVFDDSPEIEGYDPPLTAIRQHPFEIGYKGCGLLLDLLANPKRTRPVTIVVEAELVERQSVGAPKRVP